MVLQFLDLPAEIREQIYGEVLSTANSRREPIGSEVAAHYEYQLDILSTNRRIHHEAKKIFQDNIFIKITTPWMESIDHINSEGKVPIVSKGAKAASFKDFHLWVYIDAPEAVIPPHGGTFSMLTCIEDLERFTRMWRFSNLNYPGLDMHSGLNGHLRLKLTIQDPHVPDRKISKSLQERLLLPFGMVKDLQGFSLHGPKVLPSVAEALDKERMIPDPTPEQCLERGFALKDAGNKLVEMKDYKGALQKYTEAFAAVYILVSGRVRTVHADGYFIRELNSGPYKNLRGDYVRMILRVKLVANIVLTYNKMQEWAEAHFWGKRSIILFRQGMTSTESEDLSDGDAESWLRESLTMRFPAAPEMGKIFYRTACAARAMGKLADVKTLINAAAMYLPEDEIVQKEKRALDHEIV